jgi:hypothetical protein
LIDRNTPGDGAIFALIDLGNTANSIRAESTDEDWRSYVAEFWPGEERFLGLVMKFARDMSEDPAYRNPALAQILVENGARLQMTGRSYLHGMRP